MRLRTIRGKREQSPLNEEQPFRSELFSITQLSLHAKSLAGWHEVKSEGGQDRLLPRLADNEVVLLEAYELITAAVKRGRRITPAAEWFLDNYHLIEEQIRTARRHLPRGYSRELPHLATGPSAGFPAVYDIALELISHVDGRVDADNLKAFVSAYESVRPLRLGELWAIPIMLRLALLENLRRVAARLAAGRRDREQATYWVERMLEVAAKEPAKVVLVLAEMVKQEPKLTNAFSSEFASRLQGQGAAVSFATTWLEQRLAEQGETVQHVFQQASQNQAADQVSVGNSFTSLRFLSAIEWRNFVESMSVVEQTLRADPAGTYATMDFATRDRYRHAVEQIARRSRFSEDEVARKAIDLTRHRPDESREPRESNGQAGVAMPQTGDRRRTHVGYSLIDEGRRELEEAVAMRPTLLELIARIGRQFPFAFYSGAILLTASALTALVTLELGLLGVGLWPLILCALLLIVATSQLAVAVVQWASGLLVSPRLLPRLDFSEKIPDASRTLVAVPTLLTDVREVDDLLDALEVRFLANRDENLYFGLLTDFRDATAEKMPEDDALLERARLGIEALNAKYAPSIEAPATDAPADAVSDGMDGSEKDVVPSGEDRGRFFLFHRARRWNASENAWMGWERKRGKLDDLNATLRGATGRFEVIVGPVHQLPSITYVITLDSDTQLPRDAAREMVGTMAHPLNRPLFDEKKGRVTKGYGILQPRVGVSMPSAARSRFARLFSGDPGIDPYTRAVSDIYQDLFEEGSFIGKGIYEVDAFVKSLGGRLPENRILSHDLLEGAYARCGLVSDVLLFEDYPSAYPADVSRRHRWIRGDWQIAPWLLSRVPGGDASPAANVISPLSRWKVFDNMRRSLVPAALLLLLFVGWLVPGAAPLLTLVVIGIFLLPAALRAVADLTRRPGDLPLRLHVRLTSYSAARQIIQEVFSLAWLPYDAYVSLEAVARTAYRVLVSNKNLLEWRTARDAQRSARVSLAGFYLSMWVLPASAVVAFLLLALVQPASLIAAASLIAFWGLSPALAWWLSLPTHVSSHPLSLQDEMFLRGVARRTWRFFETFVGAVDNYLPPDNFQEDPPNGAAHRTSPTNVGLSLLANLTAYDFGYIPVSEVIRRVQLTLASMDKLQRYRGHLYNWYDTRSLQPLYPLYVSSVDSGNLAGHLLTLAAGFEGLLGEKLLRPSAFDGMRETLALLTALAQGKDERGGNRPEGMVSPDVIARIGRIREYLRNPPGTLGASHLLLQRLLVAATELMAAVATRPDPELKWWVGALAQQCRFFLDEITHLAPWVELPPRPEPTGGQYEPGYVPRTFALREALNRLEAVPTLGETARLELEVVPLIDAVLSAAPAVRSPETAADVDWLGRLRAALALGTERAAQQIAELRRLALRSRELADIDYGFLYDRNRKLLSIGYNVADRRLDAGCYDLLASEARLASFVAIAQGKLPQEHWFSLGRLLTTSGGRPALLSWSGSMFEYLMPLLVMPTYDGTILDETCRAVVERQIEYGRERGVPWGISESGYSKTDAQLNYQYRAFGVPGLGFKRGLADDLVVAPYASAMSVMVDPKAATDNLHRLTDDGRLGPYGFYEAIDYTSERLAPGQTSVTVRSYMAHHQGMAFLALSYVLHGRPMQRRFESDAAFRATDLLLQERVPRAPSVYPHPAEVSEARGNRDPEPNLRVFKGTQTSVPEVHLLSNGRYHVAVTATGGGYSRWRDLAVTRWHEDLARDCWGTFCYVRDVESGQFWSTAHQPTLKRASAYEAIYSQGRAEYRRRDGDIHIHVEISVSPEDDIELRRISVTNRGRGVRTIELTSYAEVVLTTAAADAAHPAFSNLFVQTELLRPRQAILCTRRPRSAGERPPWMLHLMTIDGTSVGAASYETARVDFIGRGRSIADPAAMYRPLLGDSEGSVLDPIVAIRSAVVVGPDETVRVQLVTGCHDTRDGAMALIEKYYDRRLADRVLELAWTHSQVVLRQLNAAEADTQLYGRLAGSILYTNPLLRAPASVIAANRRGQSGLWGYGISGDLPIVLLRIGDPAQIAIVRQLVQAHAYWQVKGLAVDLVIWNEDQSGYRQVLQDLIMANVDTGQLDKPGGIFVRRGEQMSEEDKVLMQSVARVILTDTAGTLADQMSRLARVAAPVPAFAPLRPRGAEVPVAVEVVREDLEAFNGIGGFTKDGREYVITTTGEHPTPAPWVNVIANPWFGSVISESGGAYTWCENAQSYRLTPWHNDPVSDASGEAFYIRDEESGRFWSPSPLPARGPMIYTTRHGFGYSIFEYTESGIASETTMYVATDAPIKFAVFKLRNLSGRPRRLSLTAYFELVMGDKRASNLPHIVTEVDPKTGVLFARNAYNGEFGQRIVFLDSSESQRTVTGDRVEFLGRNGTPARPACMARSRLSGRVGAGLDPCVAGQVMIELADGQEREIVFTFGCGRDLADARTLVGRFHGNGPARAALEAVWGHWNRTLGAVYIESPDVSVNFLANGWLLYQVLACRVWARSGFYQSGGAYGFRDQLQDVMALVHAEPAILREQLLRSAARQFREGDVQHWWHPPAGRGVRTRISDDYLWLPYAACRYIDAIGDTGVLDQTINFLDARPVKPDEESYYDLPMRSDESATLYEHCKRAIRNGLRFGEHGLPLMGCGDWNDGMNRVGEHGKGESVWLAYFLYDVLKRFAHVAASRDDQVFVQLCNDEANRLQRNIEAHAWDGEWYRRAYFDNGEPLGSASNPECRIDSLPQSWATLSHAGDPARAKQGLEKLNEMLVRRDVGVIQLFDPAFDKSNLDPGYVKGYVPGVRENGGQYTHAAVWAVMAYAEAGQVSRAWELFHLINPVRHGDSEKTIASYKVEPYVIAADVYTNPQHMGRGGWTWYTGSAGWMYRLITESLLGLKLEVNRLRFEPLLPDDWNWFKLHYRYRETFHHIHVRRVGQGQKVVRVVFDGVEQFDKMIPLRDDRQEHQAEVEIGLPAGPNGVDLHSEAGAISLGAVEEAQSSAPSAT